MSQRNRMTITVTRITYSTSVWLYTYHTIIIICSYFDQRTMAEWHLVSEKFFREIVENAKTILQECWRKDTGQLMTYDVNVTRERLPVGNNINIIYSCMCHFFVYQYWPTQHPVTFYCIIQSRHSVIIHFYIIHCRA